jgi:hypothetical protein
MVGNHWFIKEEAISDDSQDAFAHLDIARELKLKIEELGAPLTVALSGRHGIGKSSIGSLLRDQFASDSRFVFVRIEAWRHAGEWRRKAFLLDVAEELSARYIKGDLRQKKLTKITQSLSSTQATQTAVVDVPGSVQALKAVVDQMKHPVLSWAAAAFLLTLFLSFLYYLFLSGVPVHTAWLTLWHTLPSAISLPVVVACATAIYRAWTFIVGSMLEPPKVTVTTAPASSGEQFERIFREILKVALEDEHHQSAGNALVMFVDELDRLPPEEIVEALNAIRTFRDVGSCIFVVALDEEVVRRALETASSGALITDAEKAQEFLNKFFKIRQQIPPLVPRDMREFAKLLLKDKKQQRVTNGIAELPDDEVEAILDALIHRRVKTPRHVIRLINAFNSDYRLGLDREGSDSPLLSKGAITNHLPFMGVMTALREDFPDFYEAAIRNPNLIQAMDAFVSGEAPEKVEERFPDHEKLCAAYFAPLNEATVDSQGAGSEIQEVDAEASNEGGEDKDVRKPLADFGEPKDEQSRDLVLLLSETALFRPPNIRPFVYFREDATEREIGGEMTERMREEFETNAAALLRRRIQDGSTSHSKAAAQVALACLEQTKGLRKQNSVRATCDVFDLFEDIDKDRIATRVIGHLAKNGSTDIPAATLLDIVERSNVVADRERVVTKLIDRLSEQEHEVSSQDLHAILDHDELVTTIEQRKAIAAFTRELPSVQSAAELDQWLQAIVKHRHSERVIFDFFGLAFLQSLVEDIIKIEYKNLPPNYEQSLGAAFEIMDERLANDVPPTYFETVLELIDSKGWPIIDLGLKLIERHTANLDMATASASLTKILNRITGEWPDDSEAEVQRQLDLHTFVRNLTQRLGGEVLESEAATAGLNNYLKTTVVSDDGQVRDSATALLRELIGLVGGNALEPTTEALMTFVQEQMPSPQAVSAQALLVSVAANITAENLEAHFDEITRPLRQPIVDERAAFGADSLSAAYTQQESTELRVVALATSATLVSLIQVATNLPPSLIFVGRILDEVFSEIGPAQNTYVANLASYFGGTTTAANLYFALDHLLPVAERDLVPDTLKISLVASILQRWAYLADGEHKRIASKLLINWQMSLTVAQRPTYFTQQLGFLEEEPILSWEGLKPYWATLSEDQRLQIVDAATSNDALWQQLLRDIAQESAALEPTEVASLLTAASARLDENRVSALKDALLGRHSSGQKDEVADNLFATLLSAPDHLSRSSLLKISDAASESIVPNGLAYHVKLLQQDAPQRLIALQSLPTFLRGKEVSSAQGEELASAMASALQADRGERFVDNLRISKEYGFDQYLIYASKVSEMDVYLRQNIGPDDKAARKALRSYLPTKSRRGAAKPVA